jgi:hypothetical protein
VIGVPMAQDQPIDIARLDFQCLIVAREILVRVAKIKQYRPAVVADE